MWLGPVLLAQFLIVSDPEPLPKQLPTVAQVARTPLSVTPEALFSDLISTDGERLRAALRSVGLEWLNGFPLGDVALHAVNMDQDPATERLITFDAAVVVMKRVDGHWWLLGSFSCCGPSGNAAQPFSEWKELVWPGSKDLLIHAGGAQGTGVGESRLQAYRIWRGRLYRVLDIIESTYNFAGSEQITRLSIETGRISAHRLFEKGKRQTSTCTAYQWDAAAFQFLPSPRGSSDCRQ